MATRTLRFFMGPQEFSSLVWEAARKHDLVVILRGLLRRKACLEVATRPGTLLMTDGAPADNVYLAPEQPDPSWLQPNDLHPGEWGWVTSNVSYEAGDFLFMVQMGCKSDWWDSERKEVLVNPTSLVIFQKVKAVFRKRLKRPVRAGNSLTRDIWYSEGVVEWVKQGGQLAQKVGRGGGPGNVRFFIERPEIT